MFNYPETIPRDGLVGEWLLDGNALDTSGSGNNGTATDITWVASEKGYTKEVGEFNGSSSKIVTNNNVTDTTFSYYAFINSNHLPTTTNWDADFHGIVNVNNAGGTDYSYGFRTRGNKLEFFLSASNGALVDYVLSNTTLSVNKYYFVGCEFNYSTKEAKVYINGKEDNSKILDITNWNLPNHPIIIGSRGDGKASFNGKIGLLRYYNGILTKSEIKNLYLEGLRKLGPGIMLQNNGNFSKYTPINLPKPILHINGNNDGTTFFDQSGNGNHGTQSGLVVVNQIGLNKEIVFDGVDDYITRGSIFAGATICNLSFWVKGSGGTDQIIIMEQDDSGYRYNFGLFYYTGDAVGQKIRLYITSDDGTTYGVQHYDENLILNGKYHLISINYSAGQLDLYLDLKLLNPTGTINTIPGNIYSGSTKFEIGRDITGIRYFNGVLGNIMSFNKTLKQKQIEALYYSNYI